MLFMNSIVLIEKLVAKLMLKIYYSYLPYLSRYIMLANITFETQPYLTRFSSYRFKISLMLIYFTR